MQPAAWRAEDDDEDDEEAEDGVSVEDDRLMDDRMSKWEALTYYVNEEVAVAGRRRGNDEAFLPEDADTDVPLDDVERLRQSNGIRIQGQSYTQCDGSATTGAPVDKEMSDDERQNLKDEAEKRVKDWFEAEEDRDTETDKKVEKLKDDEVDFLLTHN
eukprot:g19448.t1